MKRNEEQLEPAEGPDAAESAPPPPPPPGGAAAPAPGALVEPPEEAAARLEAQLTELKDQHLRLAAEYDNFRKRTLKERSELWARARADLLLRLVEALDDLARFAHVDPETTDARTIRDGIDMVERKVWKELEAIGVTRVDDVGVVFDPNLHEAVTTAPADDPAKDRTVGAVLQPGYRLGDQLVRPARVAVLTWQDKGAGEREGEGEGQAQERGGAASRGASGETD